MKSEDIMSDVHTVDEREKKLTPWVQALLRKLRSQLEVTEVELQAVTAENERLRNVVEDKYGTRDDDSDTFLVNEDTAAELPLGKGPTVRFADFYGVRCDQSKTADGARVLIVETDDPMQIRPTGDPREIVIECAQLKS
jgi:hypothetical protein